MISGLFLATALQWSRHRLVATKPGLIVLPTVCVAAGWNVLWAAAPHWTLMVLIGSLLALLQCCCQVPQQRANTRQLVCMTLDMQSKQEVTGRLGSSTLTTVLYWLASFQTSASSLNRRSYFSLQMRCLCFSLEYQPVLISIRYQQALGDTD